MQPLSPRDVFDFVPTCDRELPKEEQTVFVLKPLTMRDRRAIQGGLAQESRGDRVIVHGVGDASLNTFLAGVVDIRNFPAKFEKRRFLGGRRRVLSEETLDLISEEVYAEVMEALTEKDSATSGDEGKD